MKAHLTVLSGRHCGKTVPITHNPFVIGREPSAHLRPASPAIEKRHCAILVEERKAVVKDFAHSTRINERPIEGAAELTDGDRLQIGPLVFRFSVDEPPDAETTPTASAAPSDEAEAAAAAMLLSKDQRTRKAPAYAVPEAPRETQTEARTGGTTSKRFEARPRSGGVQIPSVFTITETSPYHVVIHRHSGPRPPEGFREVHASIAEATLHLRGLYLGWHIMIRDNES